MSTTTVYFDNISLNVNNIDIYNLFKKFKIYKNTLITFNPNKKTKCGFIKTISKEEADKVIKELNHKDVFNSKRNIILSKCDSSYSRRSKHYQAVLEKRSIVINNLDYDLNIEDIHQLEKIINSFGMIEDMFFVFNKGICFVDLKRGIDAQHLVEREKYIYFNQKKSYIKFCYNNKDDLTVKRKYDDRALNTDHKRVKLNPLVIPNQDNRMINSPISTTSSIPYLMQSSPISFMGQHHAPQQYMAQ